MKHNLNIIGAQCLVSFAYWRFSFISYSTYFCDNRRFRHIYRVSTVRTQLHLNWVDPPPSPPTWLGDRLSSHRCTMCSRDYKHTRKVDPVVLGLAWLRPGGIPKEKMQPLGREYSCTIQKHGHIYWSDRLSVWTTPAFLVSTCKKISLEGMHFMGYKLSKTNQSVESCMVRWKTVGWPAELFIVKGAKVLCFLSSLLLLPQPSRQCLASVCHLFTLNLHCIGDACLPIHMAREISWEPKNECILVYC